MRYRIEMFRNGTCATGAGGFAQKVNKGIGVALSEPEAVATGQRFQSENCRLDTH